MNLNYDDKIEDHLDPDSDAMVWTEPKYSKNAVAKAGDILVNPPSEEEYAQALIIVNNWRASHALPLNSLQSSLRYRAQKVNPDALISQRLKRVPSIKGKLQRSQGMRLDRMQDIGGCRAVLPTIKEVYCLRDWMVKPQKRSLLQREYDYIKNPKESGYRGIHLIHKFQHRSHNGLLIEMQLRSLVQHAWATSVEIAGTFLGVALKSGEGYPQWIRFFKIVSILFSELEECTPENFSRSDIEDAKGEALFLAKRLSIVEQLRAFSVVTKYSDTFHDSPGYFLLTLKIDERKISVSSYPKTELDSVTNDYLSLEKEHKNSNVNVVLVAAESISSLRKSYPNYFADSQMFLDTLDRALGLE